MTSENSSLKIDSELRARLTALASRHGTSFEALAEAILRAHADEQERLVDEFAEDEERWQRYLATGESIPFETVRNKLRSLASAAARKVEAQ